MLITLFGISRRMLMLFAVLTAAALLPSSVGHQILMRAEIAALLDFLGSDGEDAVRTALKLIHSRSALSDAAAFLNAFEGFELTALRLLAPFVSLKFQLLGLFILSFISWKGFSQRRVRRLHALSSHKFYLYRALRLAIVVMTALSLQSACEAATLIASLELLCAFLGGACAGVSFGYDIR